MIPQTPPEDLPTKAHKMWAYDQLPQAIRKFINDCPYNWGTRVILTMLQQGANIYSVLNIMQQKTRQIVIEEEEVKKGL